MISKALLISLLLICLTVEDSVVINPITGVTQNNLMYTGTILLPDISQKLFFTFYGKDGQNTPSNLKNNQLYVAVGAPGRSSLYFNYGGLGPKILKNDLTLSDNSDSLTQYGNVMFLDLLGSGYSFVSDFANIQNLTSQDFGKLLTNALNTFIKEADIGQSKSIYLIAQSTFLRSLPGLDDIDPLQGIFHVAPWPDFYQIGKYYATGGLDTKIFGEAQRITIQATFSNCYLSQRNQKYLDAHLCYDATLNYIEANTKNRNLLNLPLQSNLTDFVPMVQYYLSQSQVVAQLKAPTDKLFEANSPKIQSLLYVDMAKNYDTQISQFYKDYLSVKHIYLVGDNDFVGYRKGVRDWLENSQSFIDSDKFKPLPITEYSVDGKVVGYTKGVTQIKYYELLNAGHFMYNDQPHVINSIIKEITVSNQKKSNPQKHLQVE